MPLNDRFRITQELHEADPTAALYLARVLDERRTELRRHQWATSERSLAHLGTPLMRSAGDGEVVVLEHDGVLVYIGLHGGFVHADVAAHEEQHALDVIAWLEEQLPPPEPVARHDVPVVFWTYSARGPIPSVRAISVPGWEEIRENYAGATQDELERIMSGFRPAHGGQLILWHGEVGTGKTFALRALAWEWRDWCQLHYIVDPDTFFGEHADYLMSVLMESHGMAAHVGMMMAMHGGNLGVSTADIVEERDWDVEDMLDEDETPRRARHWRLLVLEDTGELLRPDAKSIIGQGLSRFLNVVDGLIGQGLRILVLVTTNEQIRALHPAVARPGRCAANILFDALTDDEASAWLERHGGEGAPASGILASLYAQIEGRDAQLASFGG